MKRLTGKRNWWDLYENYSQQFVIRVKLKPVKTTALFTCRISTIEQVDWLAVTGTHLPVVVKPPGTALTPGSLTERGYSALSVPPQGCWGSWEAKMETVSMTISIQVVKGPGRTCWCWFPGMEAWFRGTHQTCRYQQIISFGKTNIFFSPQVYLYDSGWLSDERRVEDHRRQIWWLWWPDHQVSRPAKSARSRWTRWESADWRGCCLPGCREGGCSSPAPAEGLQSGPSRPRSWSGSPPCLWMSGLSPPGRCSCCQHTGPLAVSL